MNTDEAVRWQILESLRSAQVAEAAGINYTEWNRHHVFDGVSQFIKGKNRGRTPFVSYEKRGSDFEQIAFDGQLESFTWVIRVDVGGKGLNSNRWKLEEACSTIIRAFLNQYVNDNNFKGTRTSISEMTHTPWGAYREITLEGTFPDCGYEFNEA